MIGRQGGTGRRASCRSVWRAAAGRIAALLAGVIAVPILAALPAQADAGGGARPVLRVFAAASLTEVVEGLVRDFAAAEVETSFGASSDLARQIVDGAPADVFLSASPDWIEHVEQAGAAIGAPRILARNALVAIAPQGGRLAVSAKRDPIRDPAALLARLSADELVAIADPGVPAGEYARAALAKQGIAAAFEARLVGQKDVRAVLHAAEQGEVVAGFVYSTDARVARVETLFAFDPAAHPPIEYPAIVLRQSRNPELAARFLDFLASEPARARLSAAGFVLP